MTFLGSGSRRVDGAHHGGCLEPLGALDALSAARATEDEKLNGIRAGADGADEGDQDRGFRLFDARHNLCGRITGPTI